MSIFTDKIKKYPEWMLSDEQKKYGNQWCLMISDIDDKDLKNFANAIDIPKELFNLGFSSYYNITSEMKEKAIKAGAVELNLFDL